MEVGCHVPLTTLFAIKFSIYKATKAGIEFTLSAKAITSATWIPNEGEFWFNGMELDLENYPMFSKPHYRDESEHVFPFRNLLDNYAPLMKLIMKYFTCEGIFSRLYQYHVRLLMHFTATRSLNLSNYLSGVWSRW